MTATQRPVAGMLLRGSSEIELSAYLAFAETQILGEMRVDSSARSKTVADLVKLVGKETT
jgi:hypothetical protein